MDKEIVLFEQTVNIGDRRIVRVKKFVKANGETTVEISNGTTNSTWTLSLDSDEFRELQKTMRYVA